GAARQAVEAVGEIHRVRPPGDQQEGEDHEDRQRHDDQCEVPYVRQIIRRRCQSVVVRELQGQYGEGHGHHNLADGLRALVQSEVAFPADLDEIVEEADESQRHGQPDHQQTRYGRPRVTGPEPTHGVCHEVPGDQRHEYRDTAHGGCPTLGPVPVRAFLTNFLTESLFGEQPNQVRSEQDRYQQPDSGRDQNLDHSRSPCEPAASTSVVTSASTSRPIPIAFEALTNTTSPGRSCSCSSVLAASISGTRAGSSPHNPSWLAPVCIATASEPAAATTTSLSTPSRTARRPTSSCALTLSDPNSLNSPRTAQDRVPRLMVASAFSPARIDSGFALYESSRNRTPS